VPQTFDDSIFSAVNEPYYEAVVYNEGQVNCTTIIGSACQPRNHTKQKDLSGDQMLTKPVCLIDFTCAFNKLTGECS